MTKGSQGHLYKDTALILRILSRTLHWVEQSGMLSVEIPSRWFSSVDPYWSDVILNNENVGGIQKTHLSPSDKMLLPFIRRSAKELRRLWPLDKETECPPETGKAIATLGYAVHPIPEIILHDDIFRSDYFWMNFRLTASVGRELSRKMQKALCDLMSINQDQAEALMRKDGFALDIS